MSAAIRRATLSGLFGAAFAIAALLLVHTVQPGLQLQFGEDHPLPSGTALGFGGSRVVEGRVAMRSSTRGDLRLIGLDRRVPWSLRLTLRSPGATRHPRLALEADARELIQLVVPQAWTDVGVTIRPRPGARQLVVSLHDIGEDEREPGVLVDELTLTPQNWARPPASILRAAGVGGTLVGAALAFVGMNAGLIGALAFIAGVPQAIALTRGLAPFSAMPTAMIVVDGVLGMGFVVAALVRARGHVQMTVWARWAVAVTAIVIHLKLLVLLHPGVTSGDTVFHTHRFQDVLAGRWLFTSTGPGGEFPYPVGLYVLSAPLTAWCRDPTALLRTVVAFADGAAGLLLYFAAAREWGGRAALAGLCLFHLLPQNLNIQGYAFLTNAFANDLAAAALASVVLAGTTAEADRRAVCVWLGVASALALGAALSHVSSFVILGATMAGMAVLALVIAGRLRLAVQIALVLLVIAVSAWGLYYRHFTKTYQRGAGATSASTSSIEPAVPVMRAEAHQTRWVPGAAARHARAAAVPRYLWRYFGGAGIALAVLGGIWLLRTRARDVVTIAVWSWMVTCSGFLVLGVLSPIDLRYYLAAFPAVAFLGGLAVDAAWARGGSFRVVTAAVAVWAFVTGAGIWWQWLHTIDL